MKGIRQIVVGAALAGGLISCAQAHVFVGVGIAPVAPIVPVVPVVPVGAVPVYAPPPPVYYGPPPVYAAPPMVVGGYWGHPHGYYRYYGYRYWP
ncbi:MAG TPA: hypothetical protein VNE00_05425 [Paraburkholderia sp.]|nr:hypothetical protein [Paraburkholderia sp.]